MDQMTPGGDRGLFARMSRAMGTLGRIPKDGFNEHFKYAFVTDSDVADAVRKALAAEGVAFLPSVTAVERDGNRTVAQFQFTFGCETGETWQAQWMGEAIDSQDKGFAKAATSALKYFLLKTFILSTGDDADPDKDGPAKEKTTRAAAPKAQAPAPAQPKNGGNGNAPAPAAQPSGKPASIGGSKQWKGLADDLAARCPYYRNANGTTNYSHMLGAAGKCGWEIVTDENVGSVIAAIEDYAKKAANEAAQ
jgi:hypothetical protein